MTVEESAKLIGCYIPHPPDHWSCPVSIFFAGLDSILTCRRANTKSQACPQHPYHFLSHCIITRETRCCLSPTCPYWYQQSWLSHLSTQQDHQQYLLLSRTHISTLGSKPVVMEAMVDLYACQAGDMCFLLMLDSLLVNGQSSGRQFNESFLVTRC